MAAGTCTGFGPYAADAAGVSAAATALTGAYIAATDRAVVVPVANGMQFFIIHVEGG